MTPSADALLALLNATREADGAAARRFVLLNRTREVLPYHAALLWQVQQGAIGHSGVSEIDAHGPYGLWLKRLARALADRPAGRIEAADLTSTDAAIASEWQQWWPPHALWLPPEPGDRVDAPSLLLVRDVAWSDAECDALAQWMSLWRLNERATAVSARRRIVDLGAIGWVLKRALFGAGWASWLRRAVLVGLIALLGLPVQMTLRAPGELVPREPTVLRAAVEGTLRKLMVEPNQVVQAGQVLAEFDDAAVASRLQVARQALATAEAEWRQTSQQALGDPRAKAQIPAARGKLEEKLTEVRFLDQQVRRTTLTAPHAGVVLIDDASSWAGRTVQAGEALLRLAQPQDQELETWLAVGDAIDLPEGSVMKLHLASRPANPVAASLRLYAFEAEHRPDGTLAYRLRGHLSDAPTERLGARGTVRIDGPTEPLAYVVLRRPLAALREMTGW